MLSVVQTTAYVAFLRKDRAPTGVEKPLILQELLLCYSLLSATIPCMRTFVGAFRGHSLTLTDPSMPVHSSYELSNTYWLSTMVHSEATERGLSGIDATSGYELNQRPGQVSFDFSVEHRQGSQSLERLSSASDGSDRMIIRRDTRVCVERDGST